MPDIIIIADDLSGAADTGVTFAERGYQSTVIWDGSTIPSVDILVLSTESRHMPRDKAVLRVQKAVSQLSRINESAFIYKKIDSTLRGHPVAELVAVMDGFGMSKALVAPAFPAQKRVTMSGIHYVNGLPLHQTTFGKDVPTGNVRRLFRDERNQYDVLPLGLHIVRSGKDAILKEIHDCTSNRIIAVADAETKEDLFELINAGLAAGIRLYSGSAGLAAALAQTLEYKDNAAQSRKFSHDGVGILGVIASRRDNTLLQIDYAKAVGIPVVCPETAWFLNPNTIGQSITSVLKKHLSTDGMALITSHELPDLPCKSAVICSRLAAVVKELIKEAKPAGLVLTGGDMAIAVSIELGANALTLCGEMQPGIPWGYFVDGLAHGCLVVTKAGGFGEDSALTYALSFLAAKAKVPGH